MLITDKSLACFLRGNMSTSKKRTGSRCSQRILLHSCGDREQGTLASASFLYEEAEAMHDAHSRTCFVFENRLLIVRGVNLLNAMRPQMPNSGAVFY